MPATKVEGCASQVWLHPRIEAGLFSFDGDSDAMIVRGLIAVLRALYNGLAVCEVPKVDARAELARLGLNEHLSAQRSNGLRAMIERIRGRRRRHGGPEIGASSGFLQRIRFRQRAVCQDRHSP